MNSQGPASRLPSGPYSIRPRGATLSMGREPCIFIKVTEAQKRVKVRKKMIQTLDDLLDAAEGGDVFAQYNHTSHVNSFGYFKSLLMDVNLEHKIAKQWLLNPSKRTALRAISFGSQHARLAGLRSV